LTNHGPATVLGHTDGEGLSVDDAVQPALTVTFPDGVTVTELPQPEPKQGTPFCAPIINGKPDYTKHGRPIGRLYRCSFGFDISAGQTVAFGFKVKIDRAYAAPGTVVATGGPNESAPSNNTALITLGAQTGGGLPVTGARAGLIAGIGAIALLGGVGVLFVTRRWRREQAN
jgi:hypothetical protein